MAQRSATAAFTGVVFALLARMTGAQDNSGYATYSNGNGGVCSGGSSSLPGVAMNAAQFGGGSACGQCIQIQGTGNGAGSDPVSTAPYVAVITNVCSSCASGDIDLQESGSGKFGITWSFVSCPGSGRKLIENRVAAPAVSQEVVEEEVEIVEAASPSGSEQAESAAPADQDSQQAAAPAQAPEVVKAASPDSSSAAPTSQPVAASPEASPEASQQQPASRKLLLGRA